MDLVSDAGGEISFEGYLGTYSYTISHGDVLRTGTFTLDNSFQSGLENSIIISLDESLPVFVKINPSRPGFICSGELVTLQAPEGEGLSYLWEYEGAALDQLESSIVVGDSGIYTVTVAKNGISLTSAPYYLEVREAPLKEMFVDGQLEFCSNETATFSVNGGDGLEFEWYRDDMRIQWGDSLLKANQSGSYSVEITNGGCTGQSDPVELLVYPSPDAQLEVIGETIICSGERVTLEAAGISGTVYNWYRGSELLEETSHSLTVTESGSYSLVTTSDHCSSTSLAKEIEVLAANDPQCTVGIEEAQSMARVFPNPFHGVLQVELPVLPGVTGRLEVYDAVGNLVALKQVEAGTSQMTLSIDAPGIYMLRMIRGEDIEIHKVINQ